ALQPEVIWDRLKFTRLRGSNLLQDDFFSVLAKSKEEGSSFLADGLDIVIGNPPFESELSEAGALVEKSARKHNRGRGSLPDNQSAYLFLEQALGVIRPAGRICMIQPAGLLYNRKAQGFRAGIFCNHRVDTIFDFTSIRNMYDGADVKTIAVLAHADKPDPNHRVKHWTFRRTVSTHERISFELDHYDRHHVSQLQAIEESSVWRTNLLGGGRLFDMANRLRGMRTLAEYAEQMGWDYGEGFIVGNKKHDALFLTGKALLPTTAFTEAGIDESKIGTVTDTKFEGPRREALYTPPLVLIKESESLPMAYWSKDHLAYRNEIVGIHAPQSHAGELRTLYNNLRDNHRTYCLSCALNGARSLVGKATAILKQDIDILPYPEDMSEITLAFWEEALCKDVLDYMAPYVRLGQNSELLAKAADTDSLVEFSGLFCKMLGSVYDNLQAANPIFLNGLTCQPFYFGECPDLSWLTDQAEDGLKALIYDDRSHERLRTVRRLCFYFENVVLLIKPDRLRYWIQSTAIRDADETLVDLRRQGY
ncbi:MAG: Eco57I restriction-modification methylase domain-containing protein, partial [Armatimonadota bacterium]